MVAATMILFATSVIAGEHKMPEIKVSPALEKMKQLEGTWKGTTNDPGEEKIEVEYRISSGGSAVIETISPGTPHEMTSVYFDENGKLAMTHFCMLGNHPTMTLKKDEGQKLALSAPAEGPLKNDPHMHALEISFASPNSMEQKWTLFDKGKEAHTTIFKVERVS